MVDIKQRKFNMLDILIKMGSQMVNVLKSQQMECLQGKLMDLKEKKDRSLPIIIRDIIFNKDQKQNKHKKNDLFIF